MKTKRTTTKKSQARKPARRKRAAPAAKRRARRTVKGRTPRSAARKRPATKARRRKRAAPKRRPVARKRRTAAPRKKTPGAAAAGASAERPRARLVTGWQRGLGGEAGGQSGDLEAIPRREDVDSESVEELLEEGQSWEAGIVSGVEHADDETGEVRTREVPEDDVPEEYRDDKG